MVAIQGDKVGNGVQLDPWQTITSVHWGVNADIILMYDTTGSNWGTATGQYFNDVSATLNWKPGIRVGLASQGDYPVYPYGGEGDQVFVMNANFIAKKDFNFSYNPGLTENYGGDAPEAQLDAIVAACFAAWTWRENSVRILIINTDEVPHEGDGTHTTRAAAIAACQLKKVFPVYCSGTGYSLGFGQSYSYYSTTILNNVIKAARAAYPPAK